MRSLAPLSFSFLLLSIPLNAAPGPQLPERSDVDKARLFSPADVQLSGWLGERVGKNASERLAQVDLEPLLAGYRKKPGTHPWIGEHIGKWMHAATLAWANTKDPGLRKKLDYAAVELIKTQESDGYLGTYVPGKRFGIYEGADWDVWSHKYCLIGLLTYYEYTGNTAALQASRKAADLLIQTFGPGKKSILSAGTHMGMAATSVLEPIVLLYELTREEKYVQFARYIVQSWDESGGPRIVHALLSEKQVNKTANAKAYEMLSNLVGLCALARVTGDRELLKPVQIAWEDIVEHRLYLTGSASQGEHFHDDFFLPNDPKSAVAETCVTTTWIQLNLQLLRLSGEARFGNELERTFYNHLAAAQNPAGKDWCYFTPLEGAKKYQSDINCCHSSGPRGMALIPEAAYLVLQKSKEEPETLAVNLFEPSRVSGKIAGTDFVLEQRTAFPRDSLVTFVLQLKRPAKFAFALRAPQWGLPLNVQVATSGSRADAPELRDGWLVIPARRWQSGDRIAANLNLRVETITGTHGNAGRTALKYGPFVLACQAPRAEKPAEQPQPQLLVPAEKPAATLKRRGDWLEFEGSVRNAGIPQPQAATFVPFADAGASGEWFQVWLPTAQSE